MRSFLRQKFPIKNMDTYGIIEIRRCFTEHQTYLAQEEKNSQIFCGELDFYIFTCDMPQNEAGAFIPDVKMPGSVSILPPLTSPVESLLWRYTSIC